MSANHILFCASRALALIFSVQIQFTKAKRGRGEALKNTHKRQERGFPFQSDSGSRESFKSTEFETFSNAESAKFRTFQRFSE